MIAPPVRTHSPSTVVTAKQALGDLGEPTEHGIARYRTGTTNPFQLYARYGEEMMKHFDAEMTHHFKTEATPAEKRMIPYVTPGGNYRDIPDSVATTRVMRHKKEGGRTTTYARLHPDKPSYTVNAHFHTMNLGSNVHYSQDRIITVREGMRLQSFPDSFQIMSSTKAGYYKQVGNAVPPLLSLSIAERMKEYLQGDYVMAKKLKGGF
jgi:DNA (cytosine-5)-methyltransferase 1